MARIPVLSHQPRPPFFRDALVFVEYQLFTKA